MVTVAPSHWELLSWRRKISGYLQFQKSGDLQEHFGSDSMIVATVTTSERADANYAFWFTTI